MRPPPSILGPHEGCYFERPPERLVLEGYRRWLAGYDSGLGRAMGDDAGALRRAARRRGRPACARRAVAFRAHAAPMRCLPAQELPVRRAPCLPRRMRCAGVDRSPAARRSRGCHRDCLSAIACPARSADVAEAAACFADAHWPALATIFFRSRKARSKMCFHVPAPSAAPFTEEMKMTTTLSRARLSGRLAAIAASTALTAAIFVLPAKADTDPQAVITTYADIALAKYEDSLATAKLLDQAVDALIAKPSADTLNAARAAWKAARPPYQQTEVYRFGNAIVDDWEGRVNSWPLDEGLIDYVSGSYGTESDENSLYTANVIANPSIEINGTKVDASKHHAGTSVGHAAGGRRQRGQCGDRLPRDRVPAVGSGPARHRTRRWRAPLHRLRHRQLHRRQLRSPRPVSGGSHGLAGLRPRGDGRQLEGRRRGAQGAARRRAEGRRCRPSSPAWARCPMASSPASA